MEIQIAVFILISLISLIIIGLFIVLKQDWTYRLVILGIGLSTFIYSGIGISYTNVNNLYFLSYIIYLIMILFGFYLFNIKNQKKQIKINIKFGETNLNYTILIFFTSVYFVARILYLIFPVFRLENLFIPPTVNVYGVRYLKSLFQTSSILNVASYISILTLPFFFILLNHLMKKNRYKITLFLIGFWLYLDYAIFEYIGRSEALTILFFGYLVLQSKSGELIIRTKHVTWGATALVFLTPLLYWYESIRLNKSFDTANILSTYTNLFLTETSYPRYYDFLLESEISYGIGNYLFWLFTLPIPKKIFPIEIPLFNSYFTDLFDESLDYIILPSILGEAFMIFGEYLFWIHGLLIGSIIGISYNVLKKYNFTLIILIYIGVLTFSIGRGGSMEIISFCINSLITVWVAVFLSRLITKLKLN